MQFKQLSYKSSIETKPVSVSACKHVGAGSLLPLLDTRWTALFTHALELKLVFRRCLLQWTYKLYIKDGHGFSRLVKWSQYLDTFMSSRGRLFCPGYFQFGYLASCQLKLTDTWILSPHPFPQDEPTISDLRRGCAVRDGKRAVAEATFTVGKVRNMLTCSARCFFRHRQENKLILICKTCKDVRFSPTGIRKK